MYLIFDTETNGLPKKWKASPKEVDNWPRIAQLGFIVADENFQPIIEYSQFIKPDGWEIPKEKFFIDHGHSTERCESEGVPIDQALTHFILQMTKCHTLIAHNMAFDFPIVAAEMIRLGMSTDHKTEKICTMKSTIEFMSLPRMKFPKLTELHVRLFGHDFEGAHDALDDVKATLKCFEILKTRGYVQKWESGL